ncbi:glutathione s-transferase [Nannochloropsis oceanica]
MPTFDNFEQMGRESHRIEESEVDNVLHRTDRVTFFGNRLCPYAHVAWWSLLEKNIAFDYVHIDLGTHKPDWYKSKINPYGTVPTLYDHGKAVFESVIIAEYLEEKFGAKGTRLLSTDPHERAAVRLLITHFRERTLPPLYRLLKAQTPAEAKLAKELVLVEMLALELLYSKRIPNHSTSTRIKPNPSSPSSPASSPSAGPFFLGSTFSLAEICIFPFLQRLSIALQHYRGLNVLQSTHLPCLQAAYDKIQERPAWKATAQSSAFYIAVYESYANPAPSSAAGGQKSERGGWGWKVASVVSLAGATLPVVSVLSFASFLLGVGIGWSYRKGPARTGKFVTIG